MDFYYITAAGGRGVLNLPGFPGLGGGEPTLALTHCTSISKLITKLIEEMGDVPPAANLDELCKRVHSWAEAATPGHILCIGDADLIVCGFPAIQSLASRARYRVEDMDVPPFAPAAQEEDDEEDDEDFEENGPDGAPPPANGHQWFPAEDAARPQRRRPRRPEPR